MKTTARRVAASLLSFAVLLCAIPPTAQAVEQPLPPASYTAPLPSDEAKPPVEMEQKSVCAQAGVLPGSHFKGGLPASESFQINRLHEIANGTGMKVAVIDSGVSKNPRLPNLVDGGDYVAGQTALEDCDVHGTIIAGIIAAAPSTSDSFSGVAPGAEIISIRQTSAAYQPKNHEDRESQTKTSSLATLASAIVRAVNMGANVINASVTACFPADERHDTEDLAAALRYAYERNVAVVTAAGNLGESCTGNNMAVTGKDGGWKDVQTLSMPSYYSTMSISVGGSSLDGSPYLNTMPGPWVGVAAPAANIVSLNPTTGDGTLTNATVDDKGKASPLNGTSFSAAYITGLVTLLKKKYPDDTLDETRNRLYATAQRGSVTTMNITGYGTADPVAALTNIVDTSHVAQRETVQPIVVSPPTNIGLFAQPSAIVALTIVILLVFGGAIVAIISTLNSAGTSLEGEDTRLMSMREIRAAKKRRRKNSMRRRFFRRSRKKGSTK